MSFFGVNVNPFSTPVGQRIEQATDGGLASENWALNMEICDIVNETEDGPRDAIKAIKRRLNQASSKNYTVVAYALVVLETCVKNCGKRFHALAFSRDFVQELVKTIGPKNEPPAVVQEKVLSLIGAWAETFRNEPHAQGVCQVYQELRTKGIQFPVADPDASAPIMTPQRSIPEAERSAGCGPIGGGVAQGQIPAGQPVPTSVMRPERNEESNSGGDPAIVAATRGQRSLTGHPDESGILAEQPRATPLREELVAKLRSELDVVRGNMRVLSEMLTYLTGSEQTAAERQLEPADVELLQQLYATCESMQERVVELIGRLVDDEMTAELLEINDELNNLFLCYSRYTKNKVGSQQTTGVAGGTASAILARTIGQQQPAAALVETRSIRNERTAAEADSLIDLSDSLDSVATRVSDIDISGHGPTAARGTTAPLQPRDKEHDSDEFAVFAQSRNNSCDISRSKYEDEDTEPTKESVGGLPSNALLRNDSNSSPQQQRYASVSGLTNTPNPSRESEFNEMAAWLDRTPGDRGDTESLTSSEFERFLAERAAAAEALPTLPVVTAAPSQNTSSPTAGAAATTGANIQRRINKDQDKSLFAL